MADFLDLTATPDINPEIRRNSSLNNFYLQLCRRFNYLVKSAMHPAGFIPYKLNPGHLVRKLGFTQIKRGKEKKLFLATEDFTGDNEALDRNYDLKLRDNYGKYYFPEAEKQTTQPALSSDGRVPSVHL